MNAFIRVMMALPEPNRVRMVKLLGGEELCASELQDLPGKCSVNDCQASEDPGGGGLVAFRQEVSWIIHRLRQGVTLTMPGCCWRISRDDGVLSPLLALLTGTVYHRGTLMIANEDPMFPSLDTFLAQSGLSPSLIEIA